jgi:hypothetical protein
MKQKKGFTSIVRPLLILITGSVLFACSPAKFVPQGSYLLNKVEIKTDAEEIDKSDLSEYVRQSPNSYVLGAFRMQLGIYNLAGRDSTKWYNRMFHRIGQPPVIWDSLLTQISAQQLRSYHINKGYYDTQIDAVVEKKAKSLKVSYLVKSGKPYRINDYKTDISYVPLAEIAGDSLRSLIQRNGLFDVGMLNNERERVSKMMRKNGYYNFNRDHLTYLADSAEHQVNVKVQLRDFLLEKKDSLPNTIFKKYGVSSIIFRLIPSSGSVISGRQSSVNDTVTSGAYQLIGPSEEILTIGTLIAGTFITPGEMYSDEDVEKTYSSLNALPPVKYTHISFTETHADSLECNITVAEAKSFTLTSKAEITFTDGYWGMAANLGAVNRNIFKGAESLIMQGRIALERQNDVIAQEWGGQLGIKVPRMLVPFTNRQFFRKYYGSTDFMTSFSYQYRPAEFSATNVGAGIKYVWNKGRQNYNLDLIDISYVYFPWISDEFRNSFINTGKYNRYNYEDYLIMRVNYSTAFNSFNPNRPLRNFYSYRYSLESAGNLLYGLNNLLGTTTDQDGSYRIFSIRYSQYLRGEVNASYNQIFDKNNKLVYHTGLGIGVPYGNADIIPFERRFYSGGANSVRGWSESTLGPGTYQRINSRRRDYNQLGDIKIDLNVEYRAKMFWVMEGALFLDAGNNWTYKEYSNQPGGAFKLSTFWKEIAMAYGIGIRMDFDYVMFRFDLGTKLHNPANAAGDRWRVVPGDISDLAFHIAIGYPF